MIYKNLKTFGILLEKILLLTCAGTDTSLGGESHMLDTNCGTSD